MRNHLVDVEFVEYRVGILDNIMNFRTILWGLDRVHTPCLN